MIQTAGLGAFTEFDRAAVIAVGVPLMIMAGIATYFNSRASVARQSPEAAANPQTAMMNKLALYVFPLGVVVGGPFLPLAIILYWVSNNIWTFGQQHYVFGKIEKREEEKKQEALERRASNAPAPGARPKRKRKPPENATAGAVEPTESSATELSEAVEPPSTGEETTTTGSTNGSATKPSTNSAGTRSGAANRTPRQKTNNRPRKRR
jgi:YidC/Oxa1 family membrane protein insertase